MEADDIVKMAESNSVSSDNESWTILDEEEEELDNALLAARVDVVQAVAEFSKRQVQATHESSDSDIETIDEKQQEANLESLNSDGIPVGEELSESGAQYLWSTEPELTSSQETVKESVDDLDEDDLEVINEDEHEEAKTKNDSLCPSGYPPEELMDRFSEIVKGRTYLHRPNQALNLYLTATLVIVVSLVIGLGVGHFKGWSQRLELQEQYADIREERMEQLTENLVSCMTSTHVEDDQDLDNAVIRDLMAENERLRQELTLHKEITDEDNSANEEMMTILRDRINDLIVANADLEKTVEQLQNSQDNKEFINKMAHENDQLRLVVAKERYGPRQVPIEAKQQLNILQTENEELKSEVRKFRYGVYSDDLDNDLDDEAFAEDFNVTDDDEEPNFVTLSRLTYQPVLPPVILMGGKIKTFEDEIMDETDDEGFVEIEDDEEMLDEVEEVEEEPQVFNDNKYFESFKEFMKGTKNKYGFDLEQVITEFESNAKDLLPTTEQIQKIKTSAEQLGSVLKDKWNEMDLVQDFKDNKLKDKLTKTLVKALNKAKDAVKDVDGQSWSEKLSQVQEKFQSKWEQVMDKFTAKKAVNDTCQQDASKENDKKVVKKEKKYSSWSNRKNQESNTSSSWLFERAKKRDASRKEEKKSDWVFDRASSRKRFHKLSESEWFNRRLYSKHCEDDECQTIDQANFYSGSNQSGDKKQKKHSSRGETEPLKPHQAFKFHDYDDDDFDDDDDDNYIRVQHKRGFKSSSRASYAGTNRRKYFQDAETKRSGKRYPTRKQFFGPDPHVVQFVHNKAH